jgi:formylglycine-generating enzyme required for sulfatase activity
MALALLLGLAGASGAQDRASDTPGRTFRDCPDCPEMVVIPPGTFVMGTSPEEAAREKVWGPFVTMESPQHKVTIGRAFALGKFHVTRGEFAVFVKDTRYEVTNGCYPGAAGHFEFDPARNWRDPGFAQTDRDPVVCVSYEDAQQYVAWLNKRVRAEGKVAKERSVGPYRLPSEAEWEYAARAGTTTSRYWGDGTVETCEYANGADLTMGETIPNWRWSTNACRDGYAYTSPVGSFKPNQFGLYDMLGNAWQMTADCGNNGYAGAPTDGSAWTTGICQSHMVRGGSWSEHGPDLRSAHRVGNKTNSRGNIGGFRVTRDLP